MTYPPSSSSTPLRKASVFQLMRSEMAANTQNLRNYIFSPPLFLPPSLLLHRYKYPFSSPGVKLDLGSVKCLRVLALARCCLSHPAVGAQQEKALAHLSFIFLLPNRREHQKQNQKKKSTACFENKRLWSCCCLMRREKKRWERRYRCCVIFFFSPSVFCKLAVTQFSKSFVFLFFLFPSASQVTFQCRDIPSETLRLHNLKKKKKRQKDEANLLLPPLPLPLALTLFLSLAAGVWYNSLNVVIADSRLRWRENRRGVASLSDPDNATFLPV